MSSLSYLPESKNQMNSLTSFPFEIHTNLDEVDKVLSLWNTDISLSLLLNRYTVLPDIQPKVDTKEANENSLVNGEEDLAAQERYIRQLRTSLLQLVIKRLKMFQTNAALNEFDQMAKSQVLKHAVEQVIALYQKEVLIKKDFNWISMSDNSPIQFDRDTNEKLTSNTEEIIKLNTFHAGNDKTDNIDFMLSRCKIPSEEEEAEYTSSTKCHSEYVVDDFKKGSPKLDAFMETCTPIRRVTELNDAMGSNSEEYRWHGRQLGHALFELVKTCIQTN